MGGVRPAKARITEKIAGADIRVQDKAYEQAGRVSTARSKMEEMMAARKAEQEGADKEEKPVEAENYVVRAAIPRSFRAITSLLPVLPAFSVTSRIPTASIV